MTSMTEPGDITQSVPEPEQPMPAMSFYTSMIIIGMHVMQGVLGTFQLPTFIQTLSKDRPNGQKDRLFTLPSNVINVEDIKRFTPLKRDLKPKKLYKRLGKDFNSFWMSVEVPDDLLETHIRHGLSTAVEEDLDTLNLTTLENSLQAKFDSRFGGNMTNSVIELLKTWLLQKASCPVYYIWEDLGLLYWPRWVRRGLCSVKDTPFFKLTSDSPSKTPKPSHCSWPPGMHCVPAEAIQLKIFRWQCRNKKSLNNFNRFQLPGMKSSRTFSNTSKRHRGVTETSTLTRNHRSKEHFQSKDPGEFSLASNGTAALIHNIRQNGRKIDTSPTGSGLRNRRNSISAKTDTDSTSGKEMRANVKGSRNTAHGSKQDEGNDTENWSSKSWKERRRALDLKCRWLKIPYPVIDDCFCSC